MRLRELGRRRPLILLLYNDCWFDLPQSIPGCPFPYVLTSDRGALGRADAVLFHIPTLRDLPAARVWPAQQWVALSMESEVNYPLLSDPRFMAQFDLTMTYRLDADVPIPYIEPSMLAELRSPASAKTEAVPAAYFASNAHDRSGRQGYVRELMQYLPVDSYGTSLRNRTLPEDRGRPTKLATIARYRFTLAFENSLAIDYVTEKLYDALIAGSVPVYMGAPNVDAFVPASHCMINVRDFAGPHDLAHFLLYLADTPRLYDRYLAWKGTGPTNPSFLRLLRSRKVHPLCELCARIRVRSKRPRPSHAAFDLQAP